MPSIDEHYIKVLKYQLQELDTQILELQRERDNVASKLNTALGYD